MKKGRKLWEKTLAWVLAVVCCLSIVNLAPVAQKAKANASVVYVYMAKDLSTAKPTPKTNVYGAGGGGGWAESSDYILESETDNGIWYKTTKYSFPNGNTMYVYNAANNESAVGNVSIPTATSTLYIVATSSGVSLVDETTARNTYGFGASESQPATQTITLTLKDDTAENGFGTDGFNPYYIADAGAVIKVRVGETDYATTPGAIESKTSHNVTKNQVMTWTVTIPEDASQVSLRRINPNDSNNIWTQRTIPMNSRNGETTYTFTGNGETGYWGTQPETQAPETQPESQTQPEPQTQAPETEPETGFYYAPVELYDYFGNAESLELQSHSPENTDWYSTIKNSITSGNQVGRGSGDQFYWFNVSMIRHTEAYNTKRPLLVGAFNNYSGSGDNWFDFGGPLGDKAPRGDYMDWMFNHRVEINYNGYDHAVVQGLVENRLRGSDLYTFDGYKEALFDKSFFNVKVNDDGYYRGALYGDLASGDLKFPFRAETETYEGYKVGNDGKYTTETENRTRTKYIFDSGSGDNVELVNNPVNGQNNYSLVYYDGNGVSNFNGSNGYFPFNHKGDDITKRNYGIGTKLQIPFKVDIAESKTPITFEFEGDDDLWVFIDGYLVLDMGGDHSNAVGSINFTEKKATANQAVVYTTTTDNFTEANASEHIKYFRDISSDFASSFDDPTVTHTMTVFYMERGLYDSNLKVTFNFKSVKVSADKSYYAEIGTPVTDIAVPENFVNVRNDDNALYTDLLRDASKYTITSSLSEKQGTLSYNSSTGKFEYTSNSTREEAFQETITVRFYDGNEMHLTFNNYKLNPDTYVIDYGIPVSLNTPDQYGLFYNDKVVVENVASSSKIGNIGVTSSNATKGKYTLAAAGLNSNVTSAVGSNGYGTASYIAKTETEDAKYLYALGKFLDSYDTFNYAIQVVKDTVDGIASNSTEGTPIMTSKVTILPANVIYYEDNFSYTTSNETGKAIKYTGDVVVDNTGIVTQSNSWDDLYGYDKAYEEQLTDSLGGSTKLGVLPTDATNGAMAEFTFKGTGFDIISRTSSSTAGVVYTVFKDNKLEKYGMIDTNYKNGELYQLPVISVTDLDYGTHTVKVKAVRKANSTVKGIFYFDGIRIYNPANHAVDNYDHYKASEKAAGFKSVRQMLLGNCTLSDTVIKDSSDTVVASVTDIPGCEATIEGPQITENHGANTSQSVDSLVASLASAPNNEVYLANNAKLKFKATPDGDVAEANRTLQIEAKLVRTGTTSAVGNDEKASATININGTDTVINSSTAMYYNIPATNVDADGKVNVEIKIDDDSNMPSNYALSITNLKYAGYTTFEPTAASGTIPGNYTYITAVTINGGQPVGYGNTSATGTDGNPPTNEEIVADIKANDRVNVELTFKAPNNAPVTVTTNTLEVFVNGSKGVYYFADLASQGGDTPVSTVDNKMKLEVIAPKAAGNYTYEFVYTDANGNKASKVVNLKVTAKTARR